MEIEGTEETLNRLKKEVSDFKRNILSLYKTHIETLSNLPEEKNEEAAPVEEPVAEEAPVAEAVVEDIPEDTVVVDTFVASVPEDKFKSVSSLFNEE